MQTTTVRLAVPDRRRLRRVQLAWSRRRGETPMQDVLGAALRYVERHLDDFLAAGAWRPLDAAAVASLEARALDPLGWEGSVDDIDDVVYGGRA